MIPKKFSFRLASGEEKGFVSANAEVKSWGGRVTPISPLPADWRPSPEAFIGLRADQIPPPKPE